MLSLFLLFFINQKSIDSKPSENFQGIIVYTNAEKTDTLTYYIAEDKVRIKRSKRLSKKYGNYTDEVMDFQNNWTILYNTITNSVDTIEAKESSILPHFIGDTEIIKDYECESYFIEYNHSPLESYVSDEIFVAKDLNYHLPKHCKMKGTMIGNGTGKIALKQLRIVESQSRLYDYKGISLLEAIEIKPMKIKANFFELN